VQPLNLGGKGHTTHLGRNTSLGKPDVYVSDHGGGGGIDSGASGSRRVCVSGYGGGGGCDASVSGSTRLPTAVVIVVDSSVSPDLCRALTVTTAACANSPTNLPKNSCTHQNHSLRSSRLCANSPTNIGAVDAASAATAAAAASSSLSTCTASCLRHFGPQDLVGVVSVTDTGVRYCMYVITDTHTHTHTHTNTHTHTQCAYTSSRCPPPATINSFYNTRYTPIIYTHIHTHTRTQQQTHGTTQDTRQL
jgi:hypothetical protein